MSGPTPVLLHQNTGSFPEGGFWKKVCGLVHDEFQIKRKLQAIYPNCVLKREMGRCNCSYHNKHFILNGEPPVFSKPNQKIMLGKCHLTQVLWLSCVELENEFL